MAKRWPATSKDQNSKLVARDSPTRLELLLKAHKAGVSWNELWFQRLAAESAHGAWSKCEIAAAVRSDVEAAKAVRKSKDKSWANVAADGRTAAHPDVRGELPRLIAVRDEVYAMEPRLVSQTARRSAHALTNLMRLQRDPNSRHWAASAQAYIEYLKRRLASKTAGLREVPDPMTALPPPAPPAPGSMVVQRLGNDGVAVNYRVDPLAQKTRRLQLTIEFPL